MDYKYNNTSVQNCIMYSVDGSKKGRIINFNSRMCKMECCSSPLISVRWDDGKLTLPCSSMVKQISESEYQICHTPSQMAQKGFNTPEESVSK